MTVRKQVALGVGFLAIAALMAGCGGSPHTARSSHATKAATTTITVPISVLLAHTPGATNPTITQATVTSTICQPRYVNQIKSQISKKTSTEVFAEYAIATKMRSDYAIDHLVPLDLGGTNALTNLWPIPLKGTATPQLKAVVDAAVHKSMCAGFISLATAQGLFNASWPSVDTNLVTPAPTVKQLWFWSETGGTNLMRVAATVSNPGLEPINGVAMSWNALDASGALVGSHSHTIPTINALSSWTYVGGAGAAELTGTPASATVVVAQKGSYVKQAATPYAADSVQFAVSTYGIYTGATDYSVTGDITIGTNQIPSSSLDVAILLTNAAGQVVGADFDEPSNLPAVLTPGLRIGIQDDMPATSMPTTATIYAAPDA
jgi:hypothetical protein